jgi:signal transduction histidine kinase
MSVPIERSRFAELPAYPESAAREAAEQERLALAQTLHDTLCQSLSGMRLVVSLAERKAAQRHPELAPDLSELHGMVRTVCDDVHKLVEELRTPARRASHPI